MKLNICKVLSSLQCRKYFPHMSLTGVGRTGIMSWMNLDSILAMPIEGSEFTVEMGNSMPMSVYVKGTDIEG